MDRFPNVLLGLDGQRFGKKGLGTVIRFESRYRRRSLFLDIATCITIVLLTVVACRRPDGSPPDIDVETELLRVGAFGISRAKMPLADMDRSIAVRLQQLGERHGVLIQTFPIPIDRPLGPVLSLSGLIQLVVRCRAAFCPVMMEIRVGEQTLIAQKSLKRIPRLASRSMFGFDRNRSADTFWDAFRIGEEGHRRIHHAHVVNQMTTMLGRSNVARWKRPSTP